VAVTVRGRIAHNVLYGSIAARDGATGSLTGNYMTTALFVNR
jgi:hypothetical protein